MPRTDTTTEGLYADGASTDILDLSTRQRTSGTGESPATRPAGRVSAMWVDGRWPHTWPGRTAVRVAQDVRRFDSGSCQQTT